MASTFDSSEMSLRKLDKSNFNFSKDLIQDYLMVKGHIDPIETKNAPEGYKSNAWMKLDRIVHATVWMHSSKSMYFTVQS